MSDCLDIVVVGLFDGLSGGRIALDRTPHLNVLRYYSSEIDKYAIQVANKNYPQDVPYRLGSIIDIDGTKLLEDIKKEFPDARILLIGGSPCQGFSVAGKLKGSCTKDGIDVTSLEQYLQLKKDGFEFDGQSYLFWEYIRIKEELKPDYFMLENVRVTKKWKSMFDKAMGVEPTRINSSLVSAQNRDRYYWHNFGEIEQPEDKGLILRDVLETIPEDAEVKEIDKNLEVLENGNLKVPQATKKGYIEVKPGDCFDYTHPNSKTRRGRDMSKKSNTLMANSPQYFQYLGRPCELKEFNENSTCHHTANATDIKGNESIKRVYAESGKAPAMTTCQGGHREPKVLVSKNKPIYRKLTPLECERLQTLPDNYTLVLNEKGKQLVSNSARYKMIGNGWTIDVIAHIFNHITKEKK